MEYNKRFFSRDQYYNFGTCRNCDSTLFTVERRHNLVKIKLVLPAHELINYPKMATRTLTMVRIVAKIEKNNATMTAYF